MIIKQAKTGGKKIIEAKWNELIIYKDKTGFGNYTWEWNPVSEDYPNEEDSTDWYHLKRNLLNYSSSKRAWEMLNVDASDPETNIYRLGVSYNAYVAMYFSVTIPKQTTVEVEGLFQGYSRYSGNYAIFFTSTAPTSPTTLGYYKDVVGTLGQGDNIQSYTNGGHYDGEYDSSTFQTYTTTITNDTDEDKTYYVVFHFSTTDYASNYKHGLAVKYLKFTKVS